MFLTSASLAAPRARLAMRLRDEPTWAADICGLQGIREKHEVENLPRVSHPNSTLDGPCPEELRSAI